MNRLIENLRKLLSQAKLDDPVFDEPSISTAAYVCGEESKPLHVGKRRIKELFTNHWDLDYLPKGAADEILGGKVVEKLE